MAQKGEAPPLNYEEEEEEIQQLIQSLPKAAEFMGYNNLYLINYQNFWFLGDKLFQNIVKCQKHFHAHDTDLIIASHPKTGTHWLKTLLYALVDRVHNRNISESPLLSHPPLHLINRLENVNYGGGIYNYISSSHLHDLPSPRLFSTHIPYMSLPESIRTSKCRILYICRNPFDTFVSQWYFYSKVLKALHGDLGSESYRMEDYFEDYLKGKIWFGPFFEHVIDYWRQSLEKPDKVLFLKYEDLKEDPALELKKIADFVGMPFSLEEEGKGVIREIVDICDFKNMKELDVNKNEMNYTGVENKILLRKGEVGDWTNYFSPSMVERLNTLMQQKLNDTDLIFKLFP